MNEKNIIWCSADQIHQIATSQMMQVSSILDIGCGIRPQSYISPEFLICVEPYSEYADILMKNFAGTNVIILRYKALEALKMLATKSIDTIFMIDVIEHMEKEVGMQVLEECSRVARMQIIIYTPLGYMPQEVHGETDAWGMGGGEWQDHKSGWYPEEFSEWSIVACKELHFKDYKDQPIDPPYGGFYAIKTFQKEAKIAVPLEKTHPQKIIEKTISKISIYQAQTNSQKIAEFLSKSNNLGNLDQIIHLVRTEDDSVKILNSLILELQNGKDITTFLALQFYNLAINTHATNKMKRELEAREIFLGKTFCVKVGNLLKKIFQSRNP